MIRFATLLLLIAVPALAQQRPQPRRPSERPVQRVDFEEDLIEGDLRSPEGEVVVVRTPRVFHSLIVLRRDFNDKLRDSVNEL